MSQSESQEGTFFIVFDKRGFVYYMKGREPLYLDDLILTIDISKRTEERKVRDKIMEYEIRGHYVYMTISHKKGELKKYMEKYLEKNKKEEKSEEEKEEKLNFATSKLEPIKTVQKFSKKLIKKSFCLFTNKITVDELEQKLKDLLIRKNVEQKYAVMISEDIIDQYKRENIQYATEKDFKAKTKTTLQKILPKFEPSKLLEQIQEKEKKPFTICFVGVNGVGKSTTLAKISCWLLEQNLKVFIAACDTFRAGAIEQLKVHVDRFAVSGKNVGFYQSGYNKDDANVAKSAIYTAGNTGYDVVLIDTAGRMHSNKTLMNSLSKLIRINNPDHIIYVGEALAGNDSLDFIKEFNKSIKNGNEKRVIDSIILTKVDTVDDKIGQALNLTFSASSPVLFLGTGQMNKDLVPFDSDDIVDLLLI
ncbi:Srpr [Nucleospora cyclopteri]